MVIESRATKRLRSSERVYKIAVIESPSVMFITVSMAKEMP